MAGRGAGGTGTAPSTARGSVRAPRSGPAGEATTLLVIRHGRTALTEAGRFSGRDGADPQLSAAGEQDAARVAAAVARFGSAGALLPDVAAPTVVVASPMRRTRETAEAVASALPGDVTVRIDEEWIEAGFGEWEGLTYAELSERYPQQLTQWQGSTSYPPPGGGESLDTVGQRVRRARARAVEANPGRTVVVVTHATPVRVVLQEALQAGPSALWRMRVSAGGLSVVRHWEDGSAEVATANATAHLLAGPAHG